ncbi:MAG: type II toxin-antitoxin system RelE/ParE family toxin [Candidatus Taylorbacteria bacterium]
MEIVYWSEKVRNFKNNFDRITTSRVIRTVNLLEEHGPLLDMPDSKSLGKGLFELRIQGKIRIRLLYIYHNNRAYIIHGFVKKTWKIPIQDIRYARKIQDIIIGID